MFYGLLYCMCYCMFTVYITSLIQRSHSATIVSIIMLVYLLYFCVSVYMFMYVFVQDITLCQLYHVYVFWAGGRLLPNKSINSDPSSILL